MQQPQKELTRTNEVMTAGITNIPLTYPAKIFFNCETESHFMESRYILQRYGLSYEERYNKANGHYFLQTTNEIESVTLKQIWRNFKSLRPKFNSRWRYFYWELDSLDNFEVIVDVYKYLRLPVYAHRSMRGWHFISIKPISMDLFQWAVDKVRWTNEDYPPITLRIKPNKYIGEPEVFNDGLILSETNHSDTTQLVKWIKEQNFVRISEGYQLVWYSLKQAKEHENDSLEKRTELFEQQIEEYSKTGVIE